ncbi:hypothetical protein PVAND_005983 [Polypedilum vanderplanki]|uniref:cathepsin L n=1 Tax=Polypedilum vanderplanki TaxID=319348 RepID=A0A9J6C1T1_POLVA|nr:hypothetical protein PVAND_005983 [Polypedilum vanderplanki]
MYLGILVLFTNLINSYIDNHESIELWMKFKVDYNRSYETTREEEIRKEIFMDNLRKMLSHNLKQSAGLYSFKFGINQFSDMTFEEFLKINTEPGSRDKSLEQNFNAIVIHDLTSDPSNYTSFDWRDHGAVTSIKNQGYKCGSCYAFASIAAIESHIFLKTGKLLDLSEQEIVDCAQGYFTAGCYGGYEIGALNYIQNNGDITFEESYPYKGIQEKCLRSVNGTDLSKIKITIKQISQPPRENEEELKNALVKYGPIIISIDHLHESFMRYSSGVYHESDCKKQFSHAALLVGYGSENGKDYWLVKNSFGTTWGENGYFRIARNRKNNCEIATEPVIISSED